MSKKNEVVFSQPEIKRDMNLFMSHLGGDEQSLVAIICSFLDCTSLSIKMGPRGEEALVYDGTFEKDKKSFRISLLVSDGIDHPTAFYLYYNRYTYYFILWKENDSISVELSFIALTKKDKIISYSPPYKVYSYSLKDREISLNGERVKSTLDERTLKLVIDAMNVKKTRSAFKSLTKMYGSSFELQFR